MGERPKTYSHARLFILVKPDGSPIPASIGYYAHGVREWATRCVVPFNDATWSRALKDGYRVRSCSVEIRLNSSRRP